MAFSLTTTPITNNPFWAQCSSHTHQTCSFFFEGAVPYTTNFHTRWNTGLNTSPDLVFQFSWRNESSVGLHQWCPVLISLSSLFNSSICLHSDITFLSLLALSSSSACTWHFLYIIKIWGQQFVVKTVNITVEVHSVLYTTKLATGWSTCINVA